MVKNKEKGQVLLIIILVMVAVLTVGLSVMSRSITNLRISREEATSQKALAAAEAGIEQALKTNTPIPAGTTLASPGDVTTTYGVTINQISGNNVLVNGGNLVPKDEGADIWLVSHNADSTPNLSSPWNGSLQIFWGDTSGACNNAALEVVVVYSPSPYRFRRYVYDPCPGRRSNNSFSVGVSGVNVISGNSFSYLTPAIPISSGFIARVIPLYFSSSIGARASSALPSQGIRIDSTGDSGGTKRKLIVFKGYPQLPIQYFSYGLFSP